jgi:nitrite reductase/ring-hydroxylating ferredoxin subunit
MLSRSYTQEPGEAALGESQEIDDKAVFNLAVETYERDLGMARKIETREIFVAPADEIPEGGRKLVEVDGLSIGVFHHKGKWIALRNSCLHRGGPVCTGTLDGDTLTCPWHGYQYDVRDGHLYLDPSAHLARYPVEVREDGVYLRVDFLVRDEFEFSLEGLELPGEAAPAVPTLDENEFLLDQLSPGEVMELFIDGDPVAVSNVDGEYFAISGKCTHAGGPLGEGRLEGKTLICPWHDSCFDVTTGAATCGPARKPVKTYQVRIDAGKGIVLTGNGETNRAG